MKSLISTTLITISLFCASYAPAPAFAQQGEYYTFDERPLRAVNDPSFYSNGFEILPEELKPKNLASKVRNLAVSMLRWRLQSKERPQPEEKYIRKLHFGRWINDPYDSTCMNTRARVLVRDTQADPTFRPNKRNRDCVVDTGLWVDPYNGQAYDLAKDIQVDHMVPLKAAYQAGAWSWDYKTRCLYSNYMGYKEHLIPSSVRENTSKGDRGPERYLPPNQEYRCQYIKHWLAIKLIWKLNMTTDEVMAIHELVQDYNCDTNDFKLSVAELKSQRQFIKENIEFCMINKR